MLAEVQDLYRSSKKPHDIFWNRYVSRPLAAVALLALRRTPATPNQVTFASLAVAGAGTAMLVAWPGWIGLVVAALTWQASYVLDCADGQLARLRGMATPVGAHLDFLMDELKAFLLVGASATRLWLLGRDERYLVEGIAGLCIVASAISLTTFMRRPEYAPPKPLAGYEAPQALPRSPIPLALALALRLGKLIAHYPSYFLLVALANRLDLFLHAYLAVHALYAAQSLLSIVWKLGRARVAT
jgi:hypothetical protein